MGVLVLAIMLQARRSAHELLIEELKDDDMFGLEAPSGAASWSEASIRQYFESDGEVYPQPIAKPWHDNNFQPNEAAEIRLFCFHAAGSSAAMFHGAVAS